MWNVSHVDADMNLMVENAIQNQNGIMISANDVSLKNQHHIVYAKKIVLGECDKGCENSEYLK